MSHEWKTAMVEEPVSEAEKAKEKIEHLEEELEFLDNRLMRFEHALRFIEGWTPDSEWSAERLLEGLSQSTLRAADALREVKR